MNNFSKVSIDIIKGFWNKQPCNIKHSSLAVGSKEYFDEVEKRKYFVEPHISNFADFSQWSGKKVLEIGCGIGTDTINFAKHGALVTAIELSEKSLELAQKRANLYSLQDKIRFYNGNAEELTTLLPIEKYDLVYSFGVIHHTTHPEKVLEQIHNYIHPNSIIKIMIYNRYSWKVFWIGLKYCKGQVWKIPKYIAQYSEAQEGCPVTYIYSKTEARQLVETQGYKITSLQIEHIFPYSIPAYIQYKYKKVWYFRFLPKLLFDWLEKNLGWHMCITMVPANTHIQDGEN